MKFTIKWNIIKNVVRSVEGSGAGVSQEMEETVLRRPMVFIAAAFGTGVWAAFTAELPVGVWILCLLTAAAVLLLQRLGQKTHEKREMEQETTGENMAVKSLAFLCIFFLGSTFMQAETENTAPLVKKEGRAVQVSGRIIGVDKEERGIHLTVKTAEGLILVRYYGELENYRQITGKEADLHGTISLPPQRRNPGCFDYRRYLRSCGIQVQMTADTVAVSSSRPLSLTGALSHYAAKLRCRFEEKLEEETDENTKSMLTAMILGDKSGLDEALYENFRRNGTAHILAVSGLHTGMVYGLFVFLWRGRKGIRFYTCTSVLLALYAALAGFSPSVVRAAVMISLHLLAGILHRRYDLLSAAAFAFVAMLLANPMQLFHTGFQLSFLAMASLGVILPFVEKFYQGIFLSTFAIQAGMLPYTACVFNYISPGAFFANVPVVFLAGILIPAGIVTMAFSCWCDTLFQIGAAFLQQGCRLLVWINDFFYADGKTSFDVASPPVPFLILYYGILFFFVSEKGRILFIRKKWKRLVAGVLSVVVAAGIFTRAADDGFSRAQLVFVDVGQGDCLHVKTPEGKNYLLDGGGSIHYDTGKKTLKPYLLKNGIKKLDAAFVTHLHEDHYGGIRSLAQQGMVKRIGVYEGNRLLEGRLKKETGAKFLYLYKGQRIILGKGVYLDILAPEKKTENEYRQMVQNQEDENVSSLVMKVTCEGVSVLITGDLDQEGESRLAGLYGEKGLHCDILKVAHHGSKYSSCEDFIDAVSPGVAVFQVGKNNFGHPDKTVIEKYRQRFIMVYRNDISGAIGFYREKSGRGICVKKMIE